MPYLTVADPVLLLQPVPGLEGVAYWLDAGYVAAKAALAVVLWGIAAFGYLNGRVSWSGRALAAAAAGTLIFPSIATDLIGFALATVFFGWQLLVARRAGQRARLGTGEGGQARW